MIFQKYKKWIIIVLVIIAAFVLYTIFFTGEDEGEGLVSSNATTGQTPASIVGAEIVAALNRIESLRLDRTIFDDPVYKSLKDRSQEIPPEPVGKANPFDPIGSSAPESSVPDIQDSPRTSANSSVTTGSRGPSTITNQSFVSPPPVI
ncbi:hypothetical protein N9L18_00575 [Candidatus Pacebacteria bacterium]|nr:hypothetical protein [Candidatus Paceibacterota bacterium]